MQIHKNIIFKMTKQNISNGSNQKNSTEVTFLKLKFFILFHYSYQTISVEIILFFYRRVLPCKKMYFPYLFPYRSAYQPDYVLHAMPHNSLKAFTMELWDLHGVQRTGEKRRLTALHMQTMT